MKALWLHLEVTGFTKRASLARIERDCIPAAGGLD